MLITGVTISSTTSRSLDLRRVTGLVEAEFPHLKSGRSSDFKGGGVRTEGALSGSRAPGLAGGTQSVLGHWLPRSARRDEPEGAASSRFGS